MSKPDYPDIKTSEILWPRVVGTEYTGGFDLFFRDADGLHAVPLEALVRSSDTFAWGLGGIPRGVVPSVVPASAPTSRAWSLSLGDRLRVLLTGKIYTVLSLFNWGASVELAAKSKRGAHV